MQDCKTDGAFSGDAAVKGAQVGLAVSEAAMITALASCSAYHDAFKDVWIQLETIGQATVWDATTSALLAKWRRLKNESLSRGTRAVAMKADEDTDDGQRSDTLSVEEAYFVGKRNHPGQPAKGYNCQRSSSRQAGRLLQSKLGRGAGSMFAANNRLLHDAGNHVCTDLNRVRLDAAHDFPQVSSAAPAHWAKVQKTIRTRTKAITNWYADNTLLEHSQEELWAEAAEQLQWETDAARENAVAAVARSNRFGNPEDVAAILAKRMADAGIPRLAPYALGRWLEFRLFKLQTNTTMWQEIVRQRSARIPHHDHPSHQTTCRSHVSASSPTC
ncbi:unnamed protein product [Parajaminaea phylloscopi]